MANEERRYGTLLQQRYFERFGTRPCSVTEEDIRDFIEVPRLESGEIFSVSQLKASRSPRELALEVALSSEQSAQHYYSRLNQITEDAELRACIGSWRTLKPITQTFCRRKWMTRGALPATQNCSSQVRIPEVKPLARLPSGLERGRSSSRLWDGE